MSPLVDVHRQDRNPKSSCLNCPFYFARPADPDYVYQESMGRCQVDGPAFWRIVPAAEICGRHPRFHTTVLLRTDD